MNPSFFNDPKHINWGKLATLSTFACGVWAFWASVVPPRWHVPITAALGTASFVFGFVSRGTNYVKDRNNGDGQ